MVREPRMGLQHIETDTTLSGSLEELCKDKEKWTLSGLSLDEDIDSTLASIANDATKLYNCSEAEAQEHITQIVSKVGLEDAQSQAQVAMLLVSNDMLDWKDDRKSSKHRKTGANVQKFLHTVSSFLSGFKGIAEILKAIDQQAGGLAYGSVILLAATGAIKQQREEAIEDMLEELMYAFPRMNVLKELYRQPQLQILIVSIFKLTISFCREASLYFAKRSLGRVKQVFNPNDDKSRIATQLRKKLNQLRQEGEILVHEKLEDARRELSEVSIRLQQAKAQLNEIQSIGNDTNRHVYENHQRLIDAEKKAYLDELRELLGFDKRRQSQIATAKLLKCKIEREFSEKRCRGRGDPRLLSPETLLSDATYSAWLRASRSAMCLLSGSNLIDDSSVQLNWLSFASCWTFEQTTTTEKALAVFCQTDYTVNRTHRLTFATVLKSAIEQLAALHPSGLKSRREQIKKAINASDWGKQTANGYVVMIHLFAELLEDFEQGETITIVIDRLDQCYWDDDKEARKEKMNSVISSLLLDVISNESLKHLKIKVLLIMDQAPATKICRNFEWAVPKTLMCKVDWDQEADDDD